MHLKLYGELELEDGGKPLPLPKSRKTRALLVWLALNSRPQRREALCELLWSSTDDPRAGLRWSLSKLRALLGDCLLAERETIALAPGCLTTDIDLLQKLTCPVPEPQRLEQLALLESRLESGYLPALDCGDSPSFDFWLEATRRTLRQLHAGVLCLLQKASADDPAAALEFVRKRLAIDHLDTQANCDWLALVLALEGVEIARKVLEGIREQYRRAHMDDTALLAHWRRISMPQKPATAPVETEELAIPDLPARPSVAVLNFKDLSGEGILGQGLTADLITNLSRLRGLFVIARASSARFSADEHSAPQIGRMLGVRYLVQGTVQSRNNRVRLNVDLIETSQGRLVWTETFESSLDDLFLLQDELVSAVVSAIEPEIERAEYERASLLHPQNLDAWESYHMALWHSFRFTAEDTERANNFLQQALRQDARFARAHAAQSLVHFSRAFLHATDDFDREIELALTTAEHSISLDPRDAMGHWSLGRAQFLNQEHDLSLASLDRSLSANPNYAQGHYARGFVSVHAGIAAEALPELDTAQRLSPFDPLMFAMKSSRGISIALQGNYQEAALWAVRATLEPNAHYHIHAVAGACLELAGRHAEARRQIAICYSIFPNYSLQAFFRSFPYKDEGQRQLMAGALSRAGLR